MSATTKGLETATGDEIPWSSLSTRKQEILRQVAIPLSEGFSMAQIAQRLGYSTTKPVLKLMAELKAEVEALMVERHDG